MRDSAVRGGASLGNRRKKGKAIACVKGRCIDGPHHLCPNSSVSTPRLARVRLEGGLQLLEERERVRSGAGEPPDLGAVGAQLAHLSHVGLDNHAACGALPVSDDDHLGREGGGAHPARLIRSGAR